jgi:hypothetical protein
MLFPYLKGLVIIKYGFFYIYFWIYWVFSIFGDYICISIQVLNIVGDDLRFKNIVYHDGENIISKFLGRKHLIDSLNEWLQNQDVVVIGYGPIFHLLTIGLVGFIFITMEDVVNILGGNWFDGSSYLYLNPWNP